jgi:hypothetical protein
MKYNIKYLFFSEESPLSEMEGYLQWCGYFLLRGVSLGPSVESGLCGIDDAIII